MAGGGPAGPARALTSASNGPRPAATDTSETSPSTVHRTRRVPCAPATRPARAHAFAVPSVHRSAAASAARSAPPAARCRTTTACPRARTAPKTTHSTAMTPTLQTVAEPRSDPCPEPGLRAGSRCRSGHRPPSRCRSGFRPPPRCRRLSRRRQLPRRRSHPCPVSCPAGAVLAPSHSLPAGRPGLRPGGPAPRPPSCSRPRVRPFRRSRRSWIPCLTCPPPPSPPRPPPPPPVPRRAARAATEAWPRRPHAPASPPGSP